VNGFDAMSAFRFAVLSWMAACAIGARALADAPVPPTAVLTSKIATDGDFVTLPVKVEDKWLAFIVDTGSQTTTLDAKFRERLTLAGQVERAKAYPYKADPELYLPPRMTVAGTEGGAIPFPPDCAVACRDFSDVRQVSNVQIQGVLGMDFLESYALQLDLAEGSLRLLDATTIRAESRHDAEIKMEIPRRRPNVAIESHDAAMRALVDTGGLLSASIQRDAYEYLLHKRQLSEVVFLIDVEGETKLKATQEGWLRELKLGLFSHRRLSVDPDEFSIIGLYYWRRYRCIFDFPGKTIYLDKGPYFDLRDDSDHAGIYVEPVPGVERARRVAYVAKGSEGDWHGVRPGDRLISIDGKKVVAESVHSIYRRLSFHHLRPFELDLVRGEREIHITIPATGAE
jgi:hypothetical protein